MEDRDLRGEVEAHLRAILGTTQFRRAELQQRALRVLVGASLEGRTLTGQELALALYPLGSRRRAAEGHVKAVRQLAREIRLKLPEAERTLPDSPVRFVLEPHEYRIRFERRQPDPGRPEPPPSHAPGRRRPVLVLVLAAASVVGTAWVLRGSGEAARVLVRDRELVISDAGGRRLSGLEERLMERVEFDISPQDVPPETLKATLLGAGPDGRRRIALGIWNPYETDSTRLELLDARTGDPVSRVKLPYLPWARERPRGLTSRGEVVPIGLSFVVGSVTPIELDGDGLGDEALVSIFSHRSFPTQVLGLNYESDWTVFADFWQMGNALAAAIPDRDGNGADEILVYGQDNGDQRAYAVLLEPEPGRLLRGRTPPGSRGKGIAGVDEYELAGLQIRLPSTDLRKGERSSLRDRVDGVRWDPETESLELTVTDAGVDPSTGRSPSLTYRLDLDDRTASVSFDDYDVYLRVLMRLIDDGKMEDCCAIRSQDLSPYAEHLASRVELLDASTAPPTWERFSRDMP